MVSQPGVSLAPASPIEGRAEAMQRLTRLRRRLLLLHPIGFAAAIIAANGNAHKIHSYVRLALAVTITAHIILWLNMIVVAKSYSNQGAVK